jgi:hypothetical protein
MCWCRDPQSKEMTPTVAIQGISQDYVHQASPSVDAHSLSKLHIDADESEPTSYEKTEIRFSFGSQSNPQDDVNKPEPTTPPNLASFSGSQLHSQDLHNPDKTASPAAEVHPTPESVRTLWQSGRSVQSISPEQLSPDDVVIAYVSFTSSQVRTICIHPSQYHGS